MRQTIIHKGGKWLAYCLALSMAAIVYGAIPFFSIPNLGQVVWTSGFAESFVNAGWPSIQAVNFGLPEKASMAFGLSGAFLQSTFIAFFHLHASDAYALGAICWLALALWGSIRLGQLFGASFVESAFLSLVYLTLPIVWWHANYGLLSFGFALLPLYLYISLKVVYDVSEAPGISRKWILTTVSFAGVSLLSIFMDGYTFVMFFTACGIIWIVAYLRKDIDRNLLIVKALPIILASALLPYLLYTSYVGVTEFQSSSMDFFRGWGVDIVMLLIPSRGVYWLWDLLGVSALRSNAIFFGDASVWLTTFALPLILVGAIGYWLSRKHQFALPLLLIALVGFYFSLGPSLKVNSLRPVDKNGQYLVQGSLMPEDVAIAPTGNAIIYGHVPGFSNMRATYRWTGLMFAGLFGLVVLFYMNISSHRYKLLAPGIISFLIISNLPNVPYRLDYSHNYRIAMHQMDQDFVTLSNYVGTDAIVFFAPPGNDFIVNYLASLGNYRAYNIGGDKNLSIARQNWSKPLRSFKMARQSWPELNHSSDTARMEECFNSKIKQTLHDGIADFIVVPYFDLLFGAHIWPWPQDNVIASRKEFSPMINSFKSDPSFLVKEEKLYAVISLSPGAKNSASTSESPLHFNETKTLSSSCEAGLFLRNGWHNIESWGVWSSESAEMVLPIGEDCQDGNGCSLRMTFRVFNATKTVPKTVLVEMEGVQLAHWSVDSGEMREYILPLRPDLLRMEHDNKVRLAIHVPEATSPDKVSDSVDIRTLGIGLSQLELVPGNISDVDN